MPNTLFADILNQKLDLRIRVTGRSMRPVINNGDIVLLHKVPQETLQCGDIVYFMDSDGSPVLHRIISRTLQADSSYSYITKGDALLQTDAPISGDQILGKAFSVEKRLPLAGTITIGLDSIFCSSLNSLYRVLRTTRHSTGRLLKLILNSLKNT